MIINYFKKTWKGEIIYLIEPTTGYIKVNYTCDEQNCTDNKKIHTSRLSSMLDLTKLNNINHQMCRSCRTRKSEKDIKKSLITYEQIVKELTKEKYIILTTKEEFEQFLRPSATVLNVICPLGHTHTVSHNRFQQGKRCRKCYIEMKYNNAMKHKEGYAEYKFLVEQETRKTYNVYKQIIDPQNLGRNRKYHLDHKYSIYQGFIDNIDPKIIGSIHNLQMMGFDKNISKGMNCSITKEELISEYIGKN